MYNKHLKAQISKRTYFLLLQKDGFDTSTVVVILAQGALQELESLKVAVAKGYINLYYCDESG